MGAEGVGVVADSSTSNSMRQSPLRSSQYAAAGPCLLPLLVGAGAGSGPRLLSLFAGAGAGVEGAGGAGEGAWVPGSTSCLLG